MATANPESSSLSNSRWVYMSNSDYAKVIFYGVNDIYSAVEDIECSFELTDSVNPKQGDYVGLFKVGWQNVSQCVAKVCFSEAKVNNLSRRISYSVSFKAAVLPKEENEFYQFFYLTEEDLVRGASTPFQLQMSNDDLVAVNAEDDFLVVRSKLFERNAFLEQELKERLDYIYTLEAEKRSLSNDLIVTKEANTVLIASREAELKMIDELKVKLAVKEKEIAAHLNSISNLQSEVLSEKLNAEKFKVQTESLEEERAAFLEILESRKPGDCSSTEVEITMLRNQLEDTVAMLKAQEETKVLMTTELQKESEIKLGLEKELKQAKHDNTILLEHSKEKDEDFQKIKKDLDSTKQVNACIQKNLREKDQELVKVQKQLEQVLSDYNNLLKMKAEFTNLQGENELIKQELNRKHEAVYLQIEQELLKVMDDMKSFKENLVNTDLPCQMLKSDDKHQCPVESVMYLINHLKKCVAAQNAEHEKCKIECLKKEAVIEFLKKEKDQISEIHKTNKDALRDMLQRLNQAADLYKKQYIEIYNLRKQLRKCEKHRQRLSGSYSPSCSSRNSVGIAAEIGPSEHHECFSSRSSDSDTGEHLSRSTDTKVKEFLDSDLDAVFRNMVLGRQEYNSNDKSKTSTDKSSATSVSSEHSCDPLSVTESAGDILTPCSNIQDPYLLANVPSVESTHCVQETNIQASEDLISFPSPTEIASVSATAAAFTAEAFTTSTAATAAAFATSTTTTTSSAAPVASTCTETDGATKPKTRVYTLPCPSCEKNITVFADDCSAMIDHLRNVHNQQLCPVCSIMFDMSLPPKYFTFHVENHFLQRSK